MSDFLESYKKRIGYLNDSKEYYLSQAKDNFNTYINSAPNKYSALIRSKLIDLTIIDISEINKDGDAKYFLTKDNEDIVVGDVVVLQNADSIPTTWLLTDKEGLSVPSHKKFSAKPTNYTLKYINNNTIYEAPIVKAYQTMYSIGLQTDKYITTGSAKLSILITDNENTRKLTRGNRLIIDNKVWKITNDEIHDGYLKFTCDEDEINNVVDDIINGVANRWNAVNPKPNYVIDIADLTTVNRGGASNFVYSIKNNGVEVVNPSMTVTIANTNIATYNSVNKTISGISTGTTTLTMVFHGADDIDYTYTANIRVILSTSGDVNTYQILTNDSSVKGENLYAVPRYITKTFYAQRYLNSVMMDSTYTVSYSLIGCTANQVEIIINNGRVDVYNISANSGNINFTFKDNATNISSIKTINLVS